jgi:mersacidin/lichenicidin family type 2 lantibiotic
MTHLDIIRAWKDAAYRASLSEEQRMLLPEHPAGLIELTDDELDVVAGGLHAGSVNTDTGSGCCA